MTLNELMDLARRCEDAAGPDRELDLALGLTVPEPRPFSASINQQRGGKPPVPRYTASVDAALTLMPEGWWVQFVGQRIGGWNCRVETNGPPSKSLGLTFAPTAARALCAAALCARAT